MIRAMAQDAESLRTEPDRAPPEPGFAVIPCEPAERTEQARLHNACFKKPVDERALRWRYDENPAGRSITLVTRAPSGEWVSGYACNPRIATARGASAAVVGETGDVMTHPEWRKRGLFSELDRAALAEAKRRGWPLVFGLPNRRSAHIFVELGWREIGTVRPWTLLLRADASARAERAKEGRLQGWLAPYGVWHARKARAKLRERTSALRVEELREFPPEVGELSREVEQRFAFMIRREKAYLDWRFLASPSGLHRALGLFDERGALHGYAVVQRPRDSNGLAYLVDALGRTDAVAAACIEAALADLERAGASLVQATAIDGSWWGRALAGSGFLAPKEENHLTVILRELAPEHPLAAAARDPRAWYFTDGDRDDETMG
jgi:GNAT superfamily N-acetyltransferase